jgi:hypothetical protein
MQIRDFRIHIPNSAKTFNYRERYSSLNTSRHNPFPPGSKLEHAQD